MAVIAMIYSQEDQAGCTMAGAFASHFSTTQIEFEGRKVLRTKLFGHTLYLFCLKNATVYAEKVDEQLENVIGDIDVVVFLTKHDSKSGIPSLCVHTQGNWGPNDLGGNPKEIATTPVVLKNLVYQQLCKHNAVDFDVVHEATHHGPSMQKPSIFVEIGSTKAEWLRDDAADCIVRACLGAFEKYKAEESVISAVFGIGGNHTCANFNRLSQEGKILLGHVCPTYNVDNLTTDLIRQGMQKSTLLPIIVIDWKALKAPQRESILAMIDEAGYSYKKLKELKNDIE